MNNRILEIRVGRRLPDGYEYNAYTMYDTLQEVFQANATHGGFTFWAVYYGAKPQDPKDPIEFMWLTDMSDRDSLPEICEFIRGAPIKELSKQTLQRTEALSYYYNLTDDEVTLEVPA